MKTVVQFFLNNIFAKYGRNTCWLMGERFTLMGLAFISGVFIARCLGPDSYGILNFAIGYVMIFAFLIILGMDQIIVHELLLCPERENEILGSAITLRLVGCLVMLAVLLVSVYLFKVDPSSRHLIFIIFLGYIGVALNGIDAYFQARVKVVYTARIVIIWAIIMAAANIYGAFQRFPLYYFALINALIVLLPAVLKIAVYQLWFGSVLRWRCRIGEIKLILRRSGWMLWLMITGLIVSNTGYLILKAIGDNTMIGNYAIITKILSCFIVFPETLSISLFPAIASVAIESPEKYRRRRGMLYCGLFWFGILVSVFLFFFGSLFIRILYGGAYDSAANNLWISVAGFSISSVFIGFSKWCIIENRQWILSIATSCSAAGAICFTWYGGSKWGLEGAVWSFAASALLCWFGTLFCGKAIRQEIWVIFKSICGVFK